MALRGFLDRVDSAERTLAVVNRRAPDPLQRMLEKMFDRESVAIEEVDVPEADTDQVFLLEENSVVASSPLGALRDAVLLVNSDLFKTGARELDDVIVPDVLQELTDIPFSLRGYPESHSEKLLLILISRYIERIAWQKQTGRIRASFQYLARIEDEIGTHQVYQRLDDSPVDVHLYGIPGWNPPPDSSITIHAGYERDFVESWFVTYIPDDGFEDAVSLLAVEAGPNEWRGFWTQRKPLIRDMNEYIKREL